MKKYDTRKVSDITNISIKSIQRYIHDYPYAFSEAAKMPRKGREYTAQDIDNLLTIRRLKNLHADDFTIEKTLHGAFETPALPMVETENILHIAEGARQAMIEAEKSAQRANESDLSVASKLQYHDDHFFELRHTQRILENRMKAYENKLEKILQYFHDQGVIDGNDLIKKIDQVPATDADKIKAELHAQLPEKFTLIKGIKRFFQDD